MPVPYKNGRGDDCDIRNGRVDDCDVGTGRVDDCRVGNGRDHSLQKIKSLSELVGAFKTTSSKHIRQLCLPEFG